MSTGIGIDKTEKHGPLASRNEGLAKNLSMCLVGWSKWVGLNLFFLAI
jgi:hypothetical protein